MVIIKVFSFGPYLSRWWKETQKYSYDLWYWVKLQHSSIVRWVLWIILLTFCIDHRLQADPWGFISLKWLGPYRKEYWNLLVMFRSFSICWLDWSQPIYILADSSPARWFFQCRPTFQISFPPENSIFLLVLSQSYNYYYEFNKSANFQLGTFFFNHWLGDYLCSWNFFLLHRLFSLQIFLWVFEDCFETLNESFCPASIHISMINTKVNIHNFSNFYLAILNNWTISNCIDWSEKGTIHKSWKWCKGIFKAQHSQRCYTATSKLVFFESQCWNWYSQFATQKATYLNHDGNKKCREIVSRFSSFFMLSISLTFLNFICFVFDIFSNIFDAFSSNISN